jgi:phosphate/sulfate permease
MSMTHVASTAIIAAGTQRAGIDRRTIRDLVFAWVVTVPAAAIRGIVMLGITSLASPADHPALVCHNVVQTAVAK